MKSALSASSSSRDSPSHTGSGSMSLDSVQSSSYVPRPHGAALSGDHPAQAGDYNYEIDDDIALNSPEVWERFENLRR